MNLESISVVIPAYNCQHTISKCIQSIIDQSHDVNEIIIVDDGSTDGTADAIKRFDKVKYIYQDNAGPATARNQGQKHSTGHIVFFTDSDCIADAEWVRTTLKHFESENVGVVAGSYGIINAEDHLARCIHAEIRFRHLKLMPKHPKSFGSFNFAVRKSVFEQVKGFNVSYRAASGEDNDLSYKVQKAGYLIYFEPRSIVKHVHPSSVLKYLKEQYRHGFWRVKMYITHPHMALGDDYTFWKDILEVPMVFLVLLLGILGGIGVGVATVTSLSLICILLTFELIFCLVTLKKISDGIYFGFVLLIRAFARTIGFSSGILYFLPKRIVKKGK